MERKIAAKMLLTSVEIGSNMVPGSKIRGGSEIAFRRKAKNRRQYDVLVVFTTSRAGHPGAPGPLGRSGPPPGVQDDAKRADFLAVLPRLHDDLLDETSVRSTRLQMDICGLASSIFSTGSH